MKRFLAFLLIVFVLIGCNRTERPDHAAGEFGPAVPTLGVPMPTAEILAALGPENDIPIHRLLPDSVVVAVGKPKQVLASPVSTGGERLVAGAIVETLQLYAINPVNIERFILTTGFPASVLVNVPNPQNPAAMPQSRLLPIPRRATIITFNTAVDTPLLVASILEIDPDAAVLESLKRTEGKNEYYDLTPPNLGIPQRLALGMIDKRTAVIVEGVEDDIKAVFSDVIPKNAVLDRLKHTPVDTNDLTVLTSLEGLNISPEMLENMLAEISDTGYIPISFAQAIQQYLRALTLSLNLSAETGQPIVSLYAEGRDEEGAKAIEEAIRGVIRLGQATLATMNENAKQMLPIPPDFAASLLNAMTVKVQGTRVSAVLNNFETLIPTVNEGIRSRQTAAEQIALEQRRIEQLRMLAEFCAAYYIQNEKFPADILDAEGKPLLSWRVTLLPMMGLEDLYNNFKLDEPWDSETNREWANQMPYIFHPFVPEVALPKTVIRFFDSAGTPFSNRDLKLEDLESPHTTLLYIIVSPKYAVEWTKPESLEFNIDNIADISGEMFFGVSFAKQTFRMLVLPETDPQYADWQRTIEGLVKGTPLDVQDPVNTP